MPEPRALRARGTGIWLGQGGSYMVRTGEREAASVLRFDQPPSREADLRSDREPLRGSACCSAIHNRLMVRALRARF